MPAITDELRRDAEQLIADLEERAQKFRPDEDILMSARWNDELATSITRVREALAATGRQDAKLDAFAIENAYPHDMRELATLVRDMLQRPSKKVRRSSKDRQKQAEPARRAFDPPKFFAGLIFAFIFGSVFIGTVYRIGLKLFDRTFVRSPVVSASATDFVAWNGVVPPRPAKYVTDQSGVLSASALHDLNEALAHFERDTSNQVVVYVAPSMPPGATIEEVANRAFHEWGVGQKGKNNGVIFFVFTQDRQMRIEVGYGLEGVLTDALARRITSTVVKPQFQAERYEDGIVLGTRAIVAAVKKEQITDVGHTAAELASTTALNVARSGVAGTFVLFVYGFVGLLLMWFQGVKGSPNARRSGTSRRRGGWSSDSSSSGWSSSSDSSSSSSDFSGGGGDSGGGGSSDSW